MTKNKHVRNYKTTSKVMLIFTLLVFMILVATMAIIGFAMYAVSKSDTLNIQSVETIGLLTTFFLSASIIIGTLISIGIGRIVLKDVDKIIDGMQDLTHGDYEVRVPTIKSGVTKELVDNFNMLANELENTQTLRADFINDFAHEFKTPIVSISGFARLLKNGNLTEEQRLEYLNVIEEESERLSALSTNALNLTKVEKQSILSEQTKFNVSEQIRTCVLLLEKRWTAKNLELGVELDEVLIFANEEMLKQVWINLLDNAVKFSVPNSVLDIKLFDKGDYVVFSVKDKGAEIGEEEKIKIFNRFYRSKTSSGIEGNGVGLAVVKKIVDLHNGAIDVISKDGYTEFKVTIPK